GVRTPDQMVPSTPRPTDADSKRAVQPPDHIVVVIFENKHRSNVIGSRQAPYLNKLAAKGASMTHSYGVTHPSQPNYLALFSGSTRGVTSNACPRNFRKADNLGNQLRKSGRSFIGYAESLPQFGFRGCSSGRYLRKHNPWVNLGTLAASTNRPFSAFPRDYRKLPTVSFVSPNMCHDMHDCSIRTGDRWMKKHFRRYARWRPAQQPAHRHLRRERGWDSQVDSDDYRRRERTAGCLRRAARPLQAASDDRGCVRPASAWPREGRV